MRNANEVLIAPELLEQMLSEGGTRVVSVKAGPPPEARIRGVRWDAEFGHLNVALVYDRDVVEPTLTAHYDVEQRLAEQARYIARLEAALKKADNDNCGCLGFVGVLAEDGGGS